MIDTKILSIILVFTGRSTAGYHYAVPADLCHKLQYCRAMLHYPAGCGNEQHVLLVLQHVAESIM